MGFLETHAGVTLIRRPDPTQLLQHFREQLGELLETVHSLDNPDHMKLQLINAFGERRSKVSLVGSAN